MANPPVGLSKELIALRVARELQPGASVNLGIGMPTLVSNFVPDDAGVLFQAENGILGYGGIVEMPRGYLKGAAEIVRAAGGLLIIDEVQSGFGRTGDHMWGFQCDDVIPDIIIMAKGIGNGFPLGAVIARKNIAEAMADRFMFHTYGANPTSCAAGRAVLQVIGEEGLQENSRVVGAALLERLKDLQSRYGSIGDVRGRGLMLAIEIVKDRRTKEPDPNLTMRVFENCRAGKLVLSKSGPHRSVLRMVPPMCLNFDDVETVSDGLERAFAAVEN